VLRKNYSSRICGDCKASRIECKVAKEKLKELLTSEKIITFEGQCAEHNNERTT